MRILIYSFLLCICILRLDAQIAKIPFELEDDLMFVKVKINDDPNERIFVFDTGATSDLLDTKVAEDLGLEANFRQSATGAGGTKDYDIVLSQKLTLSNNITVENTHLVLSDLTRLRSSGRNFVGIIGYSLLKDYITKIDYDNNEILLFDKIENVATKGYKAIPFKFGSGLPIPQFDIRITLRNGDSFTGRVFFDSGAALALLINTPFNKENNLSKKVEKSLISKSQNLHGESTSEKIAIKSMNIGGYELGEMAVNIAHDKNGVSSYKNYLGILGGEVISKFNIILDYSTSILYLKPNSNFNKSFEFPVSGIYLRKSKGTIIVYQVEKTSPAYKLGIRKGDQLIAVNNDNSGNIQVYKNYLRKENSTVSLTILDIEGKTKKVTLKLERLL
ncbi:aspartyl protease family protein [Tenacibaculum amylolyticum]|uniref:aspartyl protease family protein n=1 Tax=Tenacibaculum amylolyticum TaxID=104269 RepID=UPI00389475FA